MILDPLPAGSPSTEILHSLQLANLSSGIHHRSETGSAFGRTKPTPKDNSFPLPFRTHPHGRPNLAG